MDIFLVYSMMVDTTREALMASPVSGKLEYRVYSDLPAIAHLSRQWDNLLAASRCNKAFGSLEWYIASCRISSPLAPYLVTATCGPEITCILPLVFNPAGRVAMFPHYANDYNDVLVRGDDLGQVAGLLKYAVSPQTACCRLILSKLRPDSDCLRAAVCLQGGPYIDYQYNDVEACFYTELPSDFDDYLTSLGRKFRKNVRRALRATEGNSLAVRELYPESLSPIKLPDTFIRLFLDRHNNGKGLFQSAVAQSFVREVLPPMFYKRSLRVFAMFEERRIIAMVLFFVAARGLLVWNGGFLAGKEHLSPGTSLYAFAIRQAIAEGIHEFDFGDGDEAYKQHWTNSEYRVGKLELVSKM